MGFLIKSNQPCKDCGSTDGLAIYDTNSYCFVEGKVKETFNRPRKATAPKPVKELRLAGNLPSPMLAWLNRYGLTIGDVNQFISFGHTPEYNGIAFKCGSGYVVRQFDAQNKYLNIGKVSPVIFPIADTALVLVEDLISAIKVRHAGFGTIALLGTGKSNLDFINMVVGLQAPEIVVWLDGDAAGKRGAKKLYNKLTLLNKCRILETEKDPKCYTYYQIKELLS